MSHPPGRGALLIGIASGFTAILCCVSPVILVLVGIVSATSAVSLGYTLYNVYGWYFRLAGILVGGISFYLYLRRRNSCSVRGARANWRSFGLVIASGVVTYAAFYWLTTYLGIAFG